MDVFGKAWEYAARNQDRVQEALIQHLELVGIALLIAISICLPLGMLTSRSRLASLLTVNLFSGLRVVPSLAVLFIGIPVFGLGETPALVALTILALPPILINTDTGLRGIDPAIKEAAAGMGMAPLQRLARVDLPLAMPVIIAGVRLATVEVIASAALAAFIGGGGLGTFITLGFQSNRTEILLVGAIPVALLALLAEGLLTLLQRALQPGRPRTSPGAS